MEKNSGCKKCENFTTWPGRPYIYGPSCWLGKYNLDPIYGSIKDIYNPEIKNDDNDCKDFVEKIPWYKKLFKSKGETNDQ